VKKAKLLVLAGLLVSLALAGCQTATPAPTEAPPEPTEAPTEVPEPTEVPAPELSPETAAILEPAAAYFGEGYQLITAEALYENLNDGDDSNDP